MKILMLSLFVFMCLQGVYAQYYPISNGSVSTCSGAFYDTGGPEKEYSGNENSIFTIKTGNLEAELVLKFSEFSLDGNDWLAVYDGNSIESELIDTYSRENPITGELRASKGCLTFVFHSDNNSTGAGWRADITCVSVGNSDLHTKEEKNGVLLIYSLRGLKSERDAEILEKLLSNQEYVIESDVHLEDQNIFVTATSEEFTYKIKDYILSLESQLGYTLAIDFLRAENSAHKDSH